MHGNSQQFAYKTVIRKPNKGEIYAHHIYRLVQLKYDGIINSIQYKTIKGMINKDETSVINFINKYSEGYKDSFNEFANRESAHYEIEITSKIKPITSTNIEYGRINIESNEVSAIDEGNKNE